MRRLFPLEAPGHKPPQVVASIKNDVRKYLKRERRKKLPEGVEFWDFDCQVGKTRETPEPAHVSELIAAIDTAASESWGQIYIEILAKPGHRTRKAGEESGEAMEAPPLPQ